MGKPSRDKGGREERKIKKIIEDAGHTCIKVPLSGAVKHYPGDLIATIRDKRYKIEVKVRRKGFKRIYGSFMPEWWGYRVEDLIVCELNYWLISFADYKSFPVVEITGLIQVKGWLQGNDALVIRVDRKQPLIILPGK